MTITTYIVDDEEHAIETIADYTNRTPGLTLLGFSRDPVSALEVLRSDDPPMLAFLDVDMPGISGLELAALITKKTKVVFITSYREFGPEAFELNAIDYLLKPISYARFLKCIQKLQLEPGFLHQNQPLDFIYVKGNIKGKYIKIMVQDILYVQTSLHYLDIYLPNETITTYLTLSELAEKLPAKDFCRVHRSYLVNLNRIKAVEQSQIRLESKELIPLGGGYRESFFGKINPSFMVSQQDKEN